MSIGTRLVMSVGFLSAAFVSAANAGDYQAVPTIADNGATAGVILLVAIGAVLMLKGGIGASASSARKDKAADEE